MRKHCRIHHLTWLRTLERVTSHEEEVTEATLTIKTQKKTAEKRAAKAAAASGAAAAPGAAAPGPSAAAMAMSPGMMPLGVDPFSPTLTALPSADELLDSLPIDLLNPDELMSGGFHLPPPSRHLY